METSGEHFRVCGQNLLLVESGFGFLDGAYIGTTLFDEFVGQHVDGVDTFLVNIHTLKCSSISHVHTNHA